MATPRIMDTPEERPKKGSTQFLSEILEELKLLRKEVKESRAESKCKCQCQCQTETESGETSHNIDASVTRLIQSHNKIWNDSLQKRKMTYYNKLQNEEKANIFEEYLAKDPPYIPDICKEKDVVGQTSEEWLKMKKEKEISNTKHNIDRMRVFAKHHEEKLEEIDATIIENFEHQTEEVKNKIKKIWQTEVKVEENVSRDIWKKKKEFLKSRPDEDKPSPSEEQRQNDAISTEARRKTTNKKNQKNIKAAPRNQQHNQVRGAVDSSNNQGPLARSNSNTWRPLQNNRSGQNPQQTYFRRNRQRTRSR